MSVALRDSPLFRLADGFTLRALALLPGMVATDPMARAGDSGVPDLSEWTRHVLASRRSAWMLEFRQGGRVAAAFPVCLETRRVRGIQLRTLSFPGYDFFDYLPLPLGEVPARIWHAGIHRMCAYFGADAAYLNNLASAPAGGLAKFALPFSNLCFDAADGGWDTLLGIQSIRRVVNKARRFYEYGVQSLDGLPPPDLFSTIAQLHIERWRYDGVTSAFVRPARRDEYLAHAERALSTIVFDGERVIAAHLGFVFGNRLLYHTPVINIEYLAASPLKLLIHETMAECAKRHLQVLDLGLGDEAYKRRYANAARPVWNLFIPRTVTGHLAFALLRENRVTGWKRRLSACGAEWVRRRARPPRVLLLDPSPGQGPAPAPTAWREITSFDAYVRTCRELAIAALRLDYERLRAGARCLFAMDGDKPLARYWVRSDTSWSDPSSPFELATPGETLWVSGAQSFSGTIAETWLPALGAYCGNARLRFVADAATGPRGEAQGLVPAGDVTHRLVRPHRSADQSP